MIRDKTINDLGEINGKILLFGGVYSNLQSLQTLQKWATENNYSPGNIFCTGDIMGYCAQPLECIQLIRKWGIRSIAGNVEIQIRNNEVDCGCDFENGGRCDIFSKNWYAYASSKINEEAKEWLHTLPDVIRFNFGGKKVSIVHGSFFHTAEFIFKSTLWQVKQKNLDAANSDIIIAGHCGLPFADEHNDKLWLNAGVTGMPANDGTDKVWFATLEQIDRKSVYKFHSYTYAKDKTRELMMQNGLPASYAETLSSGIWDNCEILPGAEINLQGIPIKF